MKQRQSRIGAMSVPTFIQQTVILKLPDRCLLCVYIFRCSIPSNLHHVRSSWHSLLHLRVRKSLIVACGRLRGRQRPMYLPWLYSIDIQPRAAPERTTRESGGEHPSISRRLHTVSEMVDKNMLYEGEENNVVVGATISVFPKHDSVSTFPRAGFNLLAYNTSTSSSPLPFTSSSSVPICFHQVFQS